MTHHYRCLQFNSESRQPSAKLTSLFSAEGMGALKQAQDACLTLKKRFTHPFVSHRNGLESCSGA